MIARAGLNLYTGAMTFSVTYRDQDSAIQQECFDAESREALFRVLEDKGIRAIHVEGITGKHKSKGAKISIRPFVWGALGLIVAVASLVVVKSLQRDNGHDEERSQRRMRIKAVETTKAAKPKQPPEEVTNIVRKASPEKVTQEERQLSPEEIEAEERRKDPLYDRHHIVAKMPLVKEPIEQLMLTVFTTELGDMPPMLPAIPAFDEERFESLINKRHVAEEGDSEDVLISKDLVNRVKDELAKFIKEGGTTSGFLSYYVNELDSAFREREMYKELQIKSMKTDDPAVARDVFLKFNERLATRGIKPLTLTRRQREYLGIEDNK